MTIPRIKSYVDCMEKWKSVRSKEKGKPISSAIRMFREPTGEFKLKHWGHYDIATIYPDNTLELTFGNYPPNQLHETVPIYEQRISKKLYRVDHSINVPRGPYGWPDKIHMTKVAPEYFKGIKFNLITGECMNPKPDHKEREDHAVSKQWKSDLTMFRKNMMARAKLGAFDDYVALLSGSNNRLLVWTPVLPWDEFLVTFADVMGDDSYPEKFTQELVRRAIYNRGYRYGSVKPPIHDLIDRQIRSIVDGNRTALKTHYGVYSPLT